VLQEGKEEEKEEKPIETEVKPIPIATAPIIPSTQPVAQPKPLVTSKMSAPLLSFGMAKKDM
jgi:hypothetical protein